LIEVYSWVGWEADTLMGALLLLLALRNFTGAANRNVCCLLQQWRRGGGTTLGERLFDFGEAAGAANVVKLIANFLLGVNLEAIAEGLALGERSGIDRSRIIDMARQTLFDCVAFNTYGPMIAHKAYAPARFPVPLGYKDMQLVSSAAERAHVPMPLLNVVHNRLMTCIAHGWVEQDWSSLDRAVLQDAGLDGSA